MIDFNGGVTHYEYDSNGRVRMMTRPNGTSKETTYDVLGQVKTVVEKNSQGEMITQFGYDYDAAGNMVKETGLNENPEIPSSETVMTYGKGNRLETYNGETVTYDADGNMTHGPLDGKMVDFVYDARNRLIQAGDTTYLYDAENNRIGMIEAGVKTTYTINPHARLTEVLESKKGDKVTQYIYGTGLIMQVTGGEYATYHYDFRGSTVAITDGKGKVTDTFTYSPYGKLLGRTGTIDTPFLYNGMYGVETDDNGLYCMRSRYYNPTIMRFINQDVVQGSLDNAVTLNRYAYANGNPITYLDPFGTSSVKRLNEILQKYIGGKSAEDISKELIIENGLGYWTAFHEIAQVNIAKALKRRGYDDVELEVSAKKKTKKIGEIDVVGRVGEPKIESIWEVKSKANLNRVKEARKQLDKYMKATNASYIKGHVQPKIIDIPVFEYTTKTGKKLNIKMMIEFPDAGEAYYSFYCDDDNGDGEEVKQYSTAAAYAMLKQQINAEKYEDWEVEGGLVVLEKMLYQDYLCLTMNDGLIDFKYLGYTFEDYKEDILQATSTNSNMIFFMPDIYVPPITVPSFGMVPAL